MSHDSFQHTFSIEKVSFLNEITAQIQKENYNKSLLLLSITPQSLSKWCQMFPHYDIMCSFYPIKIFIWYHVIVLLLGNQYPIRIYIWHHVIFADRKPLSNQEAMKGILGWIYSRMLAT